MQAPYCMFGASVQPSAVVWRRPHFILISHSFTIGMSLHKERLGPGESTEVDPQLYIPLICKIMYTHRRPVVSLVRVPRLLPPPRGVPRRVELATISWLVQGGVLRGEVTGTRTCTKVRAPAATLGASCQCHGPSLHTHAVEFRK